MNFLINKEKINKYQIFELMVNNIKFNVFTDKGLINMSKDGYAVYHNHVAFEIHLILDGVGVMNFEEEEIILNRGDLCMIAPGIIHAQKSHHEASLKKVCCFFSYQLLNKNGSISIEENKLNVVLKERKFILLQNMNNLMAIASLITHEAKEKNWCHKVKTRALYECFFIEVLRELMAMNLSESFVSTETNVLDEMEDYSRIFEIEVFFSENYNKNVSVQTLAKKIYISERQVQREIKKLYGLSFKQKLVNDRIMKAKDCLINTNLSISIISERMGYINPSKFTHIFKLKTGFTPSAFRKSNIYDIISTNKVILGD